MNEYIIGMAIILYLFSIYLITPVQQNIWKDTRNEILQRKRKGEDVCLELIMIDTSMSVVTVLFPVLLVIEKFFCWKR